MISIREFFLLLQHFLSWTIMRITLISTFVLSFTSIIAQSQTDQYIASEGPIAKAGLLANIGPNGSKCAGAAVCLSDVLISGDNVDLTLI
jgi:hypothetical protein